jgi:glycolate oxidase FAD binding subunit
LPSASSPAGTVVQRPADAQGAADVLREAAGAGRSVRIAGGETKLEWGNPLPELDVRLSTAGLDGVREFNQGDLTAVLGAGTPLAAAQEQFAQAGQMLALDPPDPGGATIGGVLATADSGPLRHRYGAARDMVLGVTVALAGGAVARAGGRVIKNVAGYDLAKLYTGSFGTLGAITEVIVRLHPRPAQTATAVGRSGDPAALARGAAALARRPLELGCLDVAWQSGRGAVLARAQGSVADGGARAAGEFLKQAGLEVDLHEEDEPLWAGQRGAQRAGGGETVVRVSGVGSQAAAAIECARDHGARLAGRAALGLFWITLPAGETSEAIAAVEEIRRRLHPSPGVVLGAPHAVRAGLDPWDHPPGTELELMRRLKVRFDPASTCNPGLFVGGL